MEAELALLAESEEKSNLLTTLENDTIETEYNLGQLPQTDIFD